MANVNSTRMRVVLVDDMTAPLLRMQEALNGFNSVLKGIGGSGAKGISSINGKVSELNASVQVASKGFAKMGASIGLVLTAYENLGRLSTMLGNSFGQVFDYAKELQTNTVGVSGILASMTQLNGKQLQWNDAMSISADIMKELKSQALQTAATSKDLMNTFRAILGPGLAKGMKISEILDFTKVGVNAVKSLGLNDVQLVQELRSILQGNIRDASSTLATALDITNQDIKDAENKAGGVFKFLMDRMKGFKESTVETIKTMAGQFEIFKEAIIVAGEEASEKILNTYSNSLAKINSKILTKQGNAMIINPEIIVMMESVANIFDYVASKGISFAEFLYDKMGMIVEYIGSFVLLPKAFELAKPAAEFLLGKVIAIKDSLSTLFNNVIGRTSEALRRSTTLNSLADSDAKALAQKTLNDLQTKNNNLLLTAGKLSKTATFNAKSMLDVFQKLGLSEEEALKRVNQYLTAVINNNKQVKVSMEQSFIAAQEANTKLTTMTSRLKNGFLGLCSMVNKLTGSLSAVGFAMLTFADNEDESTRKTAEFLIQADLMINAFGLLCGNLKTAIKLLKEYQIASKLAHIFSGPKGWAILAASSIMAAGYVGHKTDWDFDKFVKYKPFGNNGDGDESKSPLDWYEEYKKEMKARAEYGKYGYDVDLGLGNSSDDGTINKDGLTPLYPKDVDEEAKKAAEAEKQRLENIRKAQEGYEKLADTVNVAYSSLEMHNDKYSKATAEATKKTNSWLISLDDYLVKSGGVITKNAEGEKVIENYGTIGKKAYNDLVEKIKQYLSLKQQEIDLEKKLQDNKNNIQHVANLEAMGGYSQENIVSMRRTALEEYKNDLYNQLIFYKDNATRRVQIEQELASVTKQIRDNNMYDYKTAWKATLEELSQQQINYGDSIKSVFSTIENAGTNLLTSTESFGTKIKTFFSDIASGIMAEMAKIIMKGLITNAILNVFGIGKSIGTTSFSNIMQGSSINLGQSSAYSGFTGWQAASGGLHSGWGIVGEEGPELVNFSHPGRVYTAQQTANALGNAGGNVNIKIDLRNESGQQLEAESTGSSFDGENYIVGVVLKAISSNKYGMRTTLKGLANT